MIGLLGKKIGMTQIFDEDGMQIPVTVLQAGPCQVTDIRSKEKNGYTAVQLGFDEIKEKKLNKAKQGQMKKAGTVALRFIREIRTEEVEGITVGGAVKSDNFEVGDYVDVEGINIGQGFQGVVKRHGFKGGASRTHGSKVGRKPGSVGQSAYPSRVLKGTKGPGQMGNCRVTVQNLKVVSVDYENDLIAVQGAVPGVEGRYLVISTALKRGTSRKWKVQGSTEQVKEEAEVSATPQPKASQEKAQVESPQEAKPEASEENKS